MKIKIIDLLNKIANNEEVPKKIKWLGQTYEYSHNYRFYYQNSWSMYRDFYTEGNCLNEDVEIIEETKKIEKIARCDSIKMTYCGELHKPTENEEILRIKINELIDEINNLKEK